MAKSAASAERVKRLVDELGNDVVFGAYPMGARLKLAELQARYGATAFEVRRALAELASRRVVEHVVNAGFRVAQPDRRERVQMKSVRVVLETAAAPFVAARAGARDIARLRALAARFERAVARGDRRSQIAANDAFHAGLYAVAGNDVLADLIRELRDRDTTSTGRWHSAEGLSASSAEHFAIVAAIEARDPAALQQTIADHINAF